MIKQLNALKSVQPDLEWKKNNRSVLYTQVSNTGVSENFSIKFNHVAFPQRAWRIISQPVWAFVFVALIMGSVFSVRAASDTKPGDSLYIAKVISKKAQLAITFNKDEKNKLGAKFSNETAKEIMQVLSATNMSDDNEKTKVEKLTQNFKTEISNVKNKLQEITTIAEEKKQNKNNEPASEDIQVFSANLKKDKDGMQLSENEEPGDSSVLPANLSSAKSDAGSEIKSVVSDSAATIIAPASTTELIEDAKDQSEKTSSDIQANNILSEAEKLFDSQDYNGALSQLERIDAIISGDGSGEVKGASDIATSGQNVIGE